MKRWLQDHTTLACTSQGCDFPASLEAPQELPSPGFMFSAAMESSRECVISFPLIGGLEPGGLVGFLEWFPICRLQEPGVQIHTNPIHTTKLTGYLI